MHPLRLLILLVLLYLLYKLLTGKKIGRRGAGSPSPGNPRHDILVEDPVCHVYVAKSQAISLDQGEKIYYFCSRKCRDSFLRAHGGTE